MFGLIKPSLKDSAPVTEALTLADLHVGCMVGFGFVPQKNISGMRIPVTEINSYIFNADNFIAYRLESEKADVNLIIADENDPARTYLALSQRIKPRLFETLFPGNLPPDWFALKEGDVVKANVLGLGMPQGWLAPGYTLAVSTKGRFLEGDYRLRKSTELQQHSLPFEYMLLVDEDNEYALEVEKYEGGTLHVFATAYCPATDIGEIRRAPKSQAAAVDIIPHVTPLQPHLHAKGATSQKTASHLPAGIRPDGHATGGPQNNAVTSNSPDLAEGNQVQFPRMLACDARLAGKLIGEAQRNQMPLGDLIRKVLGLPLLLKEHVLVPIGLNETEIAELARRYGLDGKDAEGVRRKIVEELQGFTGEKRKA